MTEKEIADRLEAIQRTAARRLPNTEAAYQVFTALVVELAYELRA